MRYTRIDVIVAMTIAGLINMAMLIMAASVFYKSGLHHIDRSRRRIGRSQPILGGASGDAVRPGPAWDRASRAPPSAPFPARS